MAYEGAKEKHGASGKDLHRLLIGNVDGEQPDGAVEHAAAGGEAEEGEGVLDGEGGVIADERRVDLELEDTCEQRTAEDVPAGWAGMRGRKP